MEVYGALACIRRFRVNILNLSFWKVHPKKISCYTFLKHRKQMFFLLISFSSFFCVWNKIFWAKCSVSLCLKNFRDLSLNSIQCKTINGCIGKITSLRENISTFHGSDDFFNWSFQFKTIKMICLLLTISKPMSWILDKIGRRSHSVFQRMIQKN